MKIQSPLVPITWACRRQAKPCSIAASEEKENQVCFAVLKPSSFAVLVGSWCSSLRGTEHQSTLATSGGSFTGPGHPGVSGSTWEQQIWMRPRRQEDCVWIWQNSLGSWPAPCSSLHCWWVWDADTGGIWHSPHFNECTVSTVSRLTESRGKREHIWKWILDSRSKRFRLRMGTRSRGERWLSSALLRPSPFHPLSPH